VSDDFLKREIETASRTATKRRLVVLVCALTLMACCALLTFFVTRSDAKSPDQIALTAGDSVQATDENKQSSAGPKPESVNSPQTPANAAPTLQSGTAVPLPGPSGVVDHNAFVMDAQRTLVTHGNIVGLVNFGPSLSDDTKADRIKQAVDLDKGAFNQVPDIRAHLVWAGVTDGKYMDITKLIESGVSKISIGLLSLEDWADDHSDTLNLSDGSNTVSEGAALLLQASQLLGAL
jgi:hypothetical protein